MNKLLLGVALFALSVGTAQAKTNNYYISGSLGATMTNDADYTEPGINGEIKLDGTANFSGAFGVGLSDNIRTEIEVSYRNAELSEISVDGFSGTASLSGDFETWGFLVNGYYDFMPKNTFSPYVSAGLGVLHHRGEVEGVAGYSLSGVEASDTTFGYQVGAGASYNVSQNVAFDGGYRFLGSSDVDLKGSKAEYSAHEIRLGVRYSF